MKKIEAIYADAGIIVRTKAPNVAIVLTVVACLLPITIVNDLLDGRIVNAALTAIIEGIIILSILQLYRGRFRSATLMPLVLITLVLVVLSVVIEPESAYQVYVVTVYMVPPLILSLVISETEWHPLGVMLVGVATIVAVSLFVIRPVLTVEEGAFVVTRLTTSTVIYTLVGFFAFRVARTSRSAMELIEQTNTKNETSLRSIARIVQDADSSVDALRSVENEFNSAKAGADEIRRQTSSVNDRIAALRETVGQALSLIRKTTDRVSGFHVQVDEQNTVVQESTAAVNEMSASLDSVAAITSEKKEASERLVSIGEAGLEDLNRTTAAFEIVAQEVDALHEINKIVSDIAARTNLLSMNAAIEAAHAGSGGRGFAVVAEEIRKLATNTAENSRVVSERLKRLMDTVRNTSGHVEHSATSMAEIAREVRLVSEAFAEITGSTAELSSGGREILQAMQALQNSSIEVREGSDEITREQGRAAEQIESINTITEQINAAARQMDQALDSIQQSMSDLQKTIASSTQQTSALTESITRFSTGQS
ncbi:MAG: methyl-accepting chemotaxis protein [Spirochaetaceae bacterium]